MGRWLGTGLHDFVIGLFHAWTYIATAVGSGIAAGVTGWLTAWGKGFAEGRRAERRKVDREMFARHRDHGAYDLETPRPADMGPAHRRHTPRGTRHHYH